MCLCCKQLLSVLEKKTKKVLKCPYFTCRTSPCTLHRDILSGRQQNRSRPGLTHTMHTGWSQRGTHHTSSSFEGQREKGKTVSNKGELQTLFKSCCMTLLLVIKIVIHLTGCRLQDTPLDHVWIHLVFLVYCTGSRLSCWSLFATHNKDPAGQS